MAKYELIADIGTDFVNMSLKNTDFVLREPSLVLADAQNESVFLAAGLAAKRGAESENAKLVYPFAEGCVADKKAAWKSCCRLRRFLRDWIYYVFCPSARATAKKRRWRKFSTT